MIFARRQFCLSALAALAACTGPGSPQRKGRFQEQLASLEAEAGGRLGVHILDLATRDALGWRGNERFALCSTFKLSLAAMALHHSAAGRVALNERISFDEKDLVDFSPVTELHVGRGMTVEELARAAQITSDNTAANLLLARLGGPEALTGFWRSLGDPVSRLDRIEPELNVVPPGEIRDTTTPTAMAATLAEILFGETLIPPARATLLGWMRETASGKRRIRAGLPAGWDAGDKTGTGLPQDIAGTYADIAFAIPPGRAPLIMTAYYNPPAPHQDVDPAAEKVHARAGACAAAWATA